MDKIQIIDKPAKFSKIILPDESIPRAFFTKEYVETIEQIRNYAKKNFTKLPQKNFFFHHDDERQIGVERLAKYFDSKGYAVIKPENFSFYDQLNILANCERFASTVGSCSHNSIFLKDHAEVLFIPRCTAIINRLQNILNHMHDKNIFYVDSTLSVFKVNTKGPFCYLISPQLKKFFGDSERWEKEDFEILTQHVNWARAKGLEPIEDVKKYYSNVMRYFIKQLERHEDLIKNFKYLKYLKENF